MLAFAMFCHVAPCGCCCCCGCCCHDVAVVQLSYSCVHRPAKTWSLLQRCVTGVTAAQVTVLLWMLWLLAEEPSVDGSGFKEKGQGRLTLNPTACMKIVGHFILGLFFSSKYSVWASRSWQRASCQVLLLLLPQCAVSKQQLHRLVSLCLRLTMITLVLTVSVPAPGALNNPW